MKFKKLTAIVLAGVLSLGLLSCSSGSVSSSSSDVGSDTVTIGVWNGNVAEEKALSDMISGFEAKTGLKVEKKVYTDYQTQLKTDLIGGTAPDVFYVDVNIAPELISSNVLEPLKSYTNDEFNVGDFYENLVEGFQDEAGEIYAFPKDYSSLAVYYNEKLLSEAGYTKDDIPSKLEEWPSFLKELQSKLPEGKQAAMIDPQLPRLMGFIEASGASICDEEGFATLNDPKVKDTLKLFEGMYKNGSMKQASELGYGWNGDGFGSEAAAIMTEGNWVLNHLTDNFPDVKFGTIEMPTYKGNKSSLLFSVGYGMNKESKNKENAWEFINYATGSEGMTTWTTGSGTLPSRKSVSEATKVNENPILSAHIEAGNYGIPWTKGLSLPIITREFDNWMPSVILGKETLDKAMDKATNTANKDIEIQIK